MRRRWFEQRIGVGVERCPSATLTIEESQPSPNRSDRLNARKHAKAMRRAERVAAMRDEGLSYGEIARRLGVSRERARQLVLAWQEYQQRQW